MRVVILTQYYPPETGAPQERLSYLARHLAAAGHDVRVLTAKPNYPRGRFFPGFEQGLWRVSRQEGVCVIHCWLYPTRSKRILLRLLNYLSFVFSAGLVGAFLVPKADVLIVESPPLFLSITAWWLSRLRDARMILNVSDLYPETAIALGMLRQPWLQRLFYWFEAWSYSVSTLVTGQTTGIVESIRRRFPSKLVYLLTNGVDLESLTTLQTPRTSVADAQSGFVIGYAGILGYAQSLPTVIDAAALLQGHLDIQFHLYGDGPLRENLCAEVERLRLPNVKLMGHRSHAEILSLMRTWQAGLVPLADTLLMAGALPSKMFEMMSAGIPVVLSAPQGEASALISRAEAGLWAEAGSPQALADAILKLREDPNLRQRLGKNGMGHVAHHYDRKKIAEGFVSFLKQQGILKEESAATGSWQKRELRRL